jgi:hypothetical protein
MTPSFAHISKYILSPKDQVSYPLGMGGTFSGGKAVGA